MEKQLTCASGNQDVILAFNNFEHISYSATSIALCFIISLNISYSYSFASFSLSHQVIINAFAVLRDSETHRSLCPKIFTYSFVVDDWESDKGHEHIVPEK